MIWLLILVFMATAVFHLSWSRRRDGLISPYLVFLFAVVLYLVAIPVELTISGTTAVVANNLTAYMGPQEAAAVLVIAIIGLNSFALAYYFTSRDEPRARGNPFGHPAPVLAKSVLTVGILLSGATVAFFPTEVRLAQQYSTNVEQVYNNAAYALLSRVALVVLSLAAYCFFSQERGGKRLAYATVFALIAWSLYSNDKDPLILAIFALTPVITRRLASISSGVVGISVVAGTLLAGVVLQAFSDFRAGVPVRLFSAPGETFVDSDPAGPMYTVLAELTRPDGQLQYGLTFLQALGNWVPRSLWEGRPIDLSETFARENIPGWRPGYGLGYSPATEGLLNGRFLGVAVAFAILGFFFAVARNYLSKHYLTVETYIFNQAYLHVVVGYLALVALRGPLSAVISNGVRFALIYLLLRLLVGAMTRAGVDSRQPESRKLRA